MAQPKTQEELKRKQQEFLARVAAAKEKRGETLTEDDITIDKEYGKNLPTATVPSAPSTPTYTAPTYVESDIVTQAQAALNSQLANKPGASPFTWQDQLKDVIGKILNREKFSYDLNGDALYQQMADEYSRRGNLAMMDTMGQAAAMTGGFGNSYAQSVGQQAYQAHLQELNEVIPEIYKMQLDKYNMEGQELYNQYAMLGAEDDREYGQYRDEVADWLAERDYLADRYDSERNFDYGKYVDDRNFDYGVYRDSMTDYEWQKEYDLAASKVVGTTGGDNPTGGADDNTGGGANYDNGSLSTSQIKELQKAIGINADGLYGPKSKSAAGGLSAEQAYAKYVGKSGDNEGDMYADWDYGDWESYFATIRNTESKSSAEAELSRMNKAGLIPKEFIVAASIGARGSLGH